MVFRSIELNLVHRFYMPVCHGSQVLQWNFLGLTGAIIAITVKYMKYLSIKMNYTGLITTQTKFQLDQKKMKKALISQLV